MDVTLAGFVWESIKSGVAYDAIKIVLGGLTEKLTKLHDSGQKEEFNSQIETICLANQEIKQKLEELQQVVSRGGNTNQIVNSFNNNSNSPITIKV